ncbi:Stk1 family PASTA domain-containing Ser/Thr kinase [Pseudactinotalea suaedae]|uniref:Stk1 family PASTA domain-containing Ser/Thr kinase n=1 Tax=Pseudactinotalea suaedae TaxID=1524924 RepID=UPI0012E2C767|nr:Stk1 family PASTA domain-containing Ser/Thr kinase [Pseudactinotalea suaedae]
MAATVTDPVLGTIVDGRYEVISRIARGGMATVYLAQDRRLDRKVALKMMHPHLADGSDVVARFRREARAAARLSHPGVVGVFDQGTEGETSYLTMEYVDGVTLRRRLASRGALSLGEALSVMESMLDALAAAHRAGLVHRDVKPENVLIARDGTIKVADFGLARAVTEATMSSTGALLGTVAYLSPEIVTSGAADARADVYAAGVMLYEMLTGHQPFEGETPIQVAYKHVHETVPPPSEDVAWLPFEVDEYVASLTAHDPDDRPRSADAALAALRTMRAGFDDQVLAVRADVDPSLAEVAEIANEATDDVDREGHTAAVPTTPPGGTVVLPIGAVRDRDAQAEQQSSAGNRRRRTRRRRAVALILVVLFLLASAGGGAWWYLTIGPGAYTTMPDVVGRAESTAMATLDEAGLDPTTATDYSDSVPLGHVISTDPAPGDRVEKGGAVEILVSQGVLRVSIPDVAGATEADAQQELQEAGLDGTIGVERDWHPEVEAGLVVGTEPAAGSTVDHGVEVTLLVSQGREPITVPDVVGSPVDEAVEVLEDAGAVPQLGDEQFSDEIPEGSVITQDVVGEALRGDLVTLVTSKGPELFEVPNVVGQQYEQAEATLTELGFDVDRDNILGGYFGTVRSQSLEAGSWHPRGTVIVLTVV